MAHLDNAKKISANEALEKLKQGNEAYLNASANSGDISPAIRTDTAENGQHPYAIIITCSDSRVIPESIFSAGIGELFVIRVAGNIMGDHQLGSVEYAADHLGCPLAVVLGHTCCGAVGAAIEGGAEGFIRTITQEIKAAIGEETDGYKASCLNTRHNVERIQNSLNIPGLKTIGAIYHIEDGRVEFLK